MHAWYFGRTVGLGRFSFFPFFFFFFFFFSFLLFTCLFPGRSDNMLHTYLPGRPHNKRGCYHDSRVYTSICGALGNWPWAWGLAHLLCVGSDYPRNAGKSRLGTMPGRKLDAGCSQANHRSLLGAGTGINYFAHVCCRSRNQPSKGPNCSSNRYLNYGIVPGLRISTPPAECLSQSLGCAKTNVTCNQHQLV